MPAPLAPPGEGPGRARDAGATAADLNRLLLSDAGPPDPVPLREDVALPRDALTLKDGVGLSLKAVWRWGDTGAANGPEHDADAQKRAREKTALEMSVDLAPIGRMRLRFDSNSFPLPQGSELRSRLDRFGHLFVWPDGNKFRQLPAGTLRALFSERRADVTTLVVPAVRAVERGTLLGFGTERRRFTTPSGELLLERASVPGIGDSGDLLCRMLVELIAAQPDVKPCSEGSLPVKAEYRWPSGGGTTFEVVQLTRRPEMAIAYLMVPPADAEFTQAELPAPSPGVLLTRSELADLRKRDMPQKDVPIGSPPEGVAIVNRTDTLRYLLLDGIPVAWVRPHSEQLVSGPRPGRYLTSFRDFLGYEVTGPKPTPVPVRLTIGEDQRDAGAPE